MLISNATEASALAWDASTGLLPAIVQDAFDGRVLMQAWMNRDSLEQTFESGRVTFWSRTRQTLWTKGETSGNYLALKAVYTDCDRDSLLIMALPDGPTCHLGTATCFDGTSAVTPRLAFLAELERVIAQRERDRPEGSYTTSLFAEGTRRIAQKVGEEGVETALAGTAGDDEELRNESADLIFHLLVLLRSRNVGFDDVINTLVERHGKRRAK